MDDCKNSCVPIASFLFLCTRGIATRISILKFGPDHAYFYLNISPDFPALSLLPGHLTFPWLNLLICNEDKILASTS